MESVETRLQRVQDVLEIQQLRAEFCFAVDERRWEDAVSLFTTDTHVRFRRDVRGRDELLEYFRTVIGESSPYFWHFVHSQTVDVDGDTAQGWATVQTGCQVDGEDVVIAGKYEDTFQRVDGRWLFATRSARVLGRARSDVLAPPT